MGHHRLPRSTVRILPSEPPAPSPPSPTLNSSSIHASLPPTLGFSASASTHGHLGWPILWGRRGWEGAGWAVLGTAGHLRALSSSTQNRRCKWHPQVLTNIPALITGALRPRNLTQAGNSLSASRCPAHLWSASLVEGRAPLQPVGMAALALPRKVCFSPYPLLTTSRKPSMTTSHPFSLPGFL